MINPLHICAIQMGMNLTHRSTRHCFQPLATQNFSAKLGANMYSAEIKWLQFNITSTNNGVLFLKLMSCHNDKTFLQES